jgi:O-antigen/teichoic acid export membrane protein
MVSAAKLAEYSFAYKIFEISTLPLLALAPLLVPRFTQLFKNGEYPVDDLRLLLRAEMVVAVFIALLLNLCWTPLIDMVTANKYGRVNTQTIFILSLCMPLLYFNNFFWSIAFAKGRLKMILLVIAVTFVINLVGDVVLIPFFKNEGAAFAYLAAMLAQCVFYLKKNSIKALGNLWQSLVLCAFCAISSGSMAKLLFNNYWLVLVSALVMYLLTLIVTRQLSISDYKKFRNIIIR